LSIISNIKARQIIDSRGNPTVEVDIYLNDGTIGRAAVPSGASTGSREAVELRDGGIDFLGKGVMNAVNNVNTIIAPKLIGLDSINFQNIDNMLIELDGSDNKSILGANAILGVSLANVRAASIYTKKPLYEFINYQENYLMPIPMMNIVNGGSHANNNIDIQEFMIMPIGAKSFLNAMQIGVEVFHNLKNILSSKGHTTAIGDEGGFAPNLKSNEEAIEIIVQAIEKTRYNIGDDVALALDVAASEFFNSETNLYDLQSEGVSWSSQELIDYYKKLCSKYPILSIEDGLDENDWDGWVSLNTELGDSVQLVGDDLTVTNAKILSKAIDLGCMNSILIKLNQIGTVTETIDTISLANNHNYSSIVSHRSGETEDTFIADFCVAMNTGMIKTGSASRTDRTAKYNQLLRIEEELGNRAQYNSTGVFGFEKK
tara:strand:- start:880 stop:2169 length:1290 start_codon:yes stop_codon:yes gene_type:complete